MAALTAALLAASVIGGVIAGKKTADAGGSAMPALPVVPPAPVIDSAGQQAAAGLARRRADAAQGTMASTILTGPLGTTPAPTVRKTLLGS